MADGATRLRKIAFMVGGRIFRFAINPDSYTHAKPHRTTAVKTKSRIVIEDFQSDIPTITIKGTTGFNPTGVASDRGIAKIREMKEFLEDYAEMGGNGNTADEDFLFLNFTNDEYYVVHLSPEGVTYTQDANQPLMYRYEIKFTVLRKAWEPSEDEVMEPEIGNRFPSLPTGPGFNRNPFFPALEDLYERAVDRAMEEKFPEYHDDTYDTGTSNQPYTPTPNTEVINPHAPSEVSYGNGKTGLGYSLGYYGRAY